MGLLRLLLAISVVIAHSSKVLGFGLVGGQLAVQVFFIISGFYMTLILKEKYIGRNKSYKLFISNRLLRLFPVYWAVLLCTIILSIILYLDSDGNLYGRLKYYFEYADNMDFFTLLFLIFSNIALLFQDLVLFLGLDTSDGTLFFTSNFQQTKPQLHYFLMIPQAWTIGLEISFYIIAPFIVTKRLKYVIGFIILSACLRMVLYFNGFKEDPWTYRFFPTEIMFFLLGTVAYHIYKIIEKVKLRKSTLFVVYFLVLAFTLSYSWIDSNLKMYLYFIVFFFSLPFIFILSRNWKKDRFIGELSYPVYINHILIILLIRSFGVPKLGGIGFVAIIFSVLFAVILNELVAKKIEWFRQRRLKPA